MSWKGYYPDRKKPRAKAPAMAQGNAGTEGVRNGKTNNTTLTQSKARYERGVELYKAGAVSIGKDGLFRVNGFVVDVARVRCDCPDYQAHRQPCKHFYASSLFSRYGKPELVLSRSEEPVLSVAKEKEEPLREAELNSKMIPRQPRRSLCIEPWC